MTDNLRRLAQSGGLVAAAFALGYPLVAVPNVEPLTLAFFSVGFAFGPLWGLFVGITGEAVFATIHPMGMPIIPVWIGQILGMGCAGLIGGWSRPVWKGSRSLRVSAMWAALLGAGATLIFDLISNLGLAVAIGPFGPVMVAAIPFALIHIGSNALLFGMFFPILQRWLLRPTTTVVRASDSSEASARLSSSHF